MSYGSSLMIYVCMYIYIYIFLIFNVYLLLRDRERQSMSMGGVDRGGDTELEAGSKLWAVSTEPDARLNPTNCEIMPWAEVGRLTNWATQVPLYVYIFNVYLFLRDRDRMWVGEGQRDRETQNLKQAPGSELSAQSPTRGSNWRTVRSWPEPKSDA